MKIKCKLVESSSKKQKGFSLIELMVAMTIGLFIMGGVYQVFASTKQSNRILEAEAEMQENARFAFYMMTSIIQEAGNFGCQTSSALTSYSLVNTTDKTFRPSHVIEGWEAKNTSYGKPYKAKVNSGVSQTLTQHWLTSSDAVKDFGTKSKKYSDILKVWYTKKQQAQLRNPIDLSTGVLTFSALSPIDLKKGDIIAINDCQTVTFAQVCACEEAECVGNDTQADINQASCKKPGNKAFNFTYLNEQTTQISVLQSAIFFVGKRADSVSGYKNNMPSLYVRYLDNDATSGRKEEILEGVESLQILYGEDGGDNDKSPNYYISADKVVNWNNVVSIRLALLLRSHKNNVLTGGQDLSFNGMPIVVDNDDRYLRRVFTTTISLRNRNIGY